MTEKELVLTHILNCQRVELYSDCPVLNRKQSKRLKEIESLRKNGHPLQYIIGECDFMGLSFKVEEGVFIPRPETEILVEKTIELISSLPSQNRKLKVLDIGTGSGNIAISLAKFVENISLFAVDISHKALEVAKSNAEFNNVLEKIEFMQSDLFCPYNFDCIVSNPPYIASRDIPNLAEELQHEPPIALDGGADGMYFHRRIIKMSPAHLKKDKFLVMEIGHNQSDALKGLVKKTDNFDLFDIIKDYEGIDRIMVLRKKN